MPQPKAPNVRQLGEQLGVSRTTVSLALRDHPSISEATRRRIQAHAQKAGYRTNALVRALMTQIRNRRLGPSGEVIAFLTVGHTPQGPFSAPTVAAYLEGAREQAQKLGFGIEPFWLGPRGEHSRQQARVLRNRAVRGSILAPIRLDTQVLELDWNNHPVVALGYSFQQIALHRATNNHFTGMRTCYQRLRELGYKRIGLALREEDDLRVNHYWMAGFLTARQLFAGGCAQVCIFKEPRGRSDFRQWFKKARPDAIIGIYPDPALDWLRELGRAVPDEVGYASIDLATANTSRVSGIRQSSEKIAAAAVDMLATQLYTNNYGVPATPHLLLIEGTWVDGVTTARR